MARKPSGAAARNTPTATPAGGTDQIHAAAAIPAPSAPDITTQAQPKMIKVEANMENAVKSAEEFMSFSQGNFEALMKSGQIWVAGMQDLGKVVSATAQAQTEAAMGTLKAMSAAKSLKEAMDLQASLARTSFEAAMTETGKITEASVKLAEQAMAPITARVTLAMEKFGRVA